MAILVLPSLRLDLFGTKCKFKEEQKKSLPLFSPNNDIITVYERSKVTDFWTESANASDSSEIFCRVEKNISILALKMLLSILEKYFNDLTPRDQYIAELLAEWDDDNGSAKLCDKLQFIISASGISENAFTLQRLLRKIIAKKRWKLIRTFSRVIRNYQQFTADYYSPPSEIKLGGKGYVSAMDSFNCKLEALNGKMEH